MPSGAATTAEAPAPSKQQAALAPAANTTMSASSQTTGAADVPPRQPRASERPRRVIRMVDFDSCAALRVVKGSFLGTIALQIGGRMVPRRSVTWKAAAQYVFPIFCIREYFVTPVLHSKRWNTWRGVSIRQQQRPGLFYLVPDSVVAAQLAGLAVMLNLSAVIPNLAAALGAQLSCNALRIAGWWVFHTKASPPAPAAVSLRPSAPPQADKPHPSTASLTEVEQPTEAGTASHRLTAPLALSEPGLINMLPSPKPQEGGASQEHPDALLPDTEAPPLGSIQARDAPPDTSQPSVWWRAWKGARRVLHV